MADNILRLKVDSQEYDAKLKRAAEGLQHYADSCRKVGGTLEYVEKDTLDFVKAIGQMETVSRSAAGQLSEMKQAFVDFSLQYKQMSDAEKASPIGKALSESLETLKGRITETKAQLADINKEIGETGSTSSNTGNILTDLSSKIGINTKQLMGWGAAIGAAKVALDVAIDAFNSSQTNIDEWGRTVESAESLYNGFLNALNNSDISGFLTRIDDIINAARNAYNAISDLQMYTAFNQVNVAKGRANYAQALDEYKLNPTPENKSKLSEANENVINELKEAQVKTDAAYRSALQKIAEERLKTKALQDKFVDTFANKSYEEFQAAGSSFKTGSLLNIGSQYYYGDRVYDGNIQDRGTGKWRAMSEAEKEEFEFARAISQTTKDQVKEIQALGAQSVSIIQQIYQQDRQYNRMAGNNQKPTPTRTSGGSTRTVLTPEQQAAVDIEKAQKDYAASINSAQQKLVENMMNDDQYNKQVLSGQQKLADAYLKAYNITGDEKYLEGFREVAVQVNEMSGVIDASAKAQKEAEEAAKALATAQKKLTDAETERANALKANDLKAYLAANKKVVGAGGESAMPLDFTYTQSNLDAFISNLKERISQADVGSELLDSLNDQLADAQSLGNLMKTAIENGLNAAQFDPQEIFKRILGDGKTAGDYIGNEFWQNILNSMSQQTGKKISLNTTTGAVTTAKGKEGGIEQFASDFSKMTGAVNSIVSGVQNLGVQIPEGLAKTIGAIQTISGILTAILTVTTLIQATQTAKGGFDILSGFAKIGMAVIGMNRGGVVPHAAVGYLVQGNHYSNDMTPIMANAGELVLNKAQQGNLASQLEGGGLQNLNLSATITGEQIRLVLNNNGRRTGRGEYVTTNFQRG